jgi:ribonuclease P protein component
VTNKTRQRFTLPKHKILRRNKAIQQVFEAGTFIKGKWFDAVYLRGAEPAGQIAFAASGRARNAVERNRIKRKLREAFRLEQITLPETCRAILIGNPKIIQAEAQAVRVEMKRVFHAAGLTT